MSIEVVTPAADQNLTTLDRVTAELGSSADPVILEHLIPEASAMVAQHCGRVFIEERVKESFTGTDTRNQLLERTPLSTIHGLEFEGEAEGDPPIIDDPDAGVIWRDSGFPAPRVSEVVSRPESRGRRSWTVDYTGGFVLTGTRTLPFDIESATVEVIKWLYAKRCRDPAVSQQKIGDFQQESYVSGLPSHIAEMLKPWRRGC